ncbi:MAG: radical SAM protein [Nitrospirota bacterium]
MLPQIANHIQNRLNRRYAPLSLVHFVTNRCNARCSHCFIDFAPERTHADELTLDDIGRVARSLGSGLYNVNLTGGEPFLREDMPDIVACYASATKAQSIVITTNGWFTDAIRRSAERYRHCSSTCRITYSISLDDIRERHDGSRNLTGLYDRALESYRLMSSWSDPRISATVALTVTPENASQIENIYRSLKAAGVTSVFPVLLREEGVLRTIADRESLCQAYGRLTRLIDRSREPFKHGRRIAEAAHRAKNRIVHQILGNNETTGRFHIPCAAGASFATIMADGSVAPCELLALRHPMGNLRENDMKFSGIWNSVRAHQVRRSIRENRCHCTFECAWTVNVLARPVFWPRLAFTTLRELL